MKWVPGKGQPSSDASPVQAVLMDGNGGHFLQGPESEESPGCVLAAALADPAALLC